MKRSSSSHFALNSCPFALSLSKCHRIGDAGFDKLSPNGLFALTAKA
jgi:hypothetical protein